MWKWIRNCVFGAESLRKQAYIQFVLACCLFPLIFLPNRILLQLTFFLSVWAIIISAQTFISAAEGRKKAEEIEAKKVEADVVETKDFHASS